MKHSRMTTHRWVSGFVLIEGLVAMLVFAVGLLGAAKLQATLVRSTAEAKARTEAMTIAQARMDKLRHFIQESEHTAAASCAAGTITAASASPVASAGINASFSESWTVQVNCTPKRHTVNVTVAWTDSAGANSNVNLTGMIAWNAPRNMNLQGSASGGGGGVGTPSVTRLGDNVKDYDSLPEGSIANGKDGSFKYFNNTTGGWELLVPASGGYRVALYSEVHLVKLTGIVALDTYNSGGTDLRPTGASLSGITVYRTDITFCMFPLKFTNENDPLTYGSTGGDTTGQTSSSSDTAGAYVCYVPEGWKGNVGLLNTGDSGNSVCPEDVVNDTVFEGRRHKVLIKNSGGTIVGESGLLPGHEAAFMPGSTTLTRLSRLDFLVFKKKTSGASSGRVISCADRFDGTPSAPSGSAPAAYTIVQRTGAPVDRSSTFTAGIPSVAFSEYIVDSYIQGETGGFLEVSGTATLCTAPVIATGSGSSLNVNYACAKTSGSFSCSVGVGWTGTIKSGTYASGTVGPVSVAVSGVTIPCP